jgi:hypothetical protein
MVLALWTLEAKCANDPKIQESLKLVRSGQGYDPFYPNSGAGREKLAGAWAKEYCADCPVRLACLAEALKSIDLDNQWKQDQEQGIWGGLTKRSRVALKKKQQKQLQEISMRLTELFPDADENRIA